MNDIKIKINGVSETLFLTLYSRAIESETKDPIIEDKKSIEIVNQLDKIFCKSDSKLQKMLFNRKLSKGYITAIALRTKKFDEYVSDFLSKNPNGIIVNMGCGLETRFYRIDNGKAEWYDIDLLQVIELKKQLINENNRYHLIGSSLLDYAWMENLSQHKGRAFMFLAEGVFQYLHENEVKSLILKLQKNFSGCELVCGVVSSRVKKMRKISLLADYSRSKYNIDKNVTINFGISKSDEFTSWNSGIKFLDERSFYDTPVKKIRLMKVYDFFDIFKKIEWIVHYKLI